jgi:hypothetical protein
LTSRRLSGVAALCGLASVALVLGTSPGANADPSGSPTANRIFFNCTFTTADLQSILDIPTINGLFNHQVVPSYIIIYNRQNPNEGQKIGTTSTYTGPVLCINSDTENVVPTSEGTLIPNATNQPGVPAVNILGAEEVLHLQYRSTLTTNPAKTEKRVCHTIAGNTDCFFIQPTP